MSPRALLATSVLCAAVFGVAVVLSMRPKEPGPLAPRTPGHSRILDRRDPAVKKGLEEIDALRRMRALKRIPMGGVGDVDYEEALQRLRRSSSPLLFFLEETSLDRRESAALRIDLLNLVAQHPGEETRRFLAALVVDSSEDESVRIAALEHFMKYRDAATFEILLAASRYFMKCSR